MHLNGYPAKYLCRPLGWDLSGKFLQKSVEIDCSNKKLNHPMKIIYDCEKT